MSDRPFQTIAFRVARALRRRLRDLFQTAPRALTVAVQDDPKRDQQAHVVAEAPTPDPGRVREFVPPGHFYSPIVDPAELRQSNFEVRRRKDALLGVTLDYDAMAELFQSFVAENGAVVFPETHTPDRRYHSINDQFGWGDAFVLSSMIRHFKPRQIIEVGSGFSSAVTLDTLDSMGRTDTVCTFIDPFTERIEALLKPGDHERVRVNRAFVQDVDPDFFTSLERDDFLFLDTTHISKTGSDVNYEVFDILPRLQSGVIVHFHDVFQDFDYPDQWIYNDNRSWNELYLLRAFLMYNTAFEVIYFNTAIAHRRTDLVRSLKPRILDNPGGGLWLRKR